LPLDLLSPSRSTFPVLDPPPQAQNWLDPNGVDGDAYFLNETILKSTPTAANFPYCEGSFEMRWKPNWSSSDLALATPHAVESLLEVQDAADPNHPLRMFRLLYEVLDDEEGSTNRLPQSFFQMNFPQDTVVDGNAGTNTSAIRIPARSWMVAGQWYH